MRAKKFFFNFCLLVVFLVLGLRLFQLQILQGNKYQKLAQENRIRKIKILGPRGIIFDRHGEILAKNTAVFKLKEDSQERVISRDEALELQAEGNDQNLFTDFQRAYPSGDIFGHVIGYLGEIGNEEIKRDYSFGMEKLKMKGEYEIGDWKGRAGIEEFYEDKLRGKDGGELVEVNTQGKILRRIGKVEPVPGENLTLAIDADLQKAAQAAFAKATASQVKGAVVATNPKTGEVLILFSSPSFDPNYFISRRSEEVIKKYLTDTENRPLLNRAISGTYPPGSTFKIVTATAGLEEKKITKDTLINDPGVIYVGAYKYSNWYFTGYGRTEGNINIIRAIKRSTDTFFYKLGEMVGIEKLVYWAKKFGLDKLYEIDLGGEIAGFVPTPEWKQKVKGEPWFLGNTYHLSIGQGDVALTPLGVNMMTAAIANGGKICQPKMLKVGLNDKVNPCQEIGIKKETIEVIKEGMVEACSSGGTGWPFFDFKASSLPANESQHEPYTNSIEKASAKTGRVGCKTGTAEYVEDGKTKTHAWFTVFAPSDDPTIVLTVLIEGGGEGSSVAGPIAKEILKEFFK